MWDFNHPPLKAALAERYHLTFTPPSECARRILSGEADLGLIPVAALTSDLVIVPGCTIASLSRVRSIQLIVKAPLHLDQVRTVAADPASRSSAAYLQVIFRHFLGTDPAFHAAPANAEAMLAGADAALLIGDPALLALERRTKIEALVGPCTWHDVAAEWIARTGHPWVAAVWAVRPDALKDRADQQALIDDLSGSRDHGLAHIDDLVCEWTPHIALPASTIRAYLRENIHYHLDGACIAAIEHFRALAAETHVLPALPKLPFLQP